ncbi:MAG: hypothetical protein ACPG5Z_00145 [Pseudoalteromonas sp.]
MTPEQLKLEGEKKLCIQNGGELYKLFECVSYQFFDLKDSVQTRSHEIIAQNCEHLFHDLDRLQELVLKASEALQCYVCGETRSNGECLSFCPAQMHYEEELTESELYDANQDMLTDRRRDEGF